MTNNNTGLTSQGWIDLAKSFEGLDTFINTAAVVFAAIVVLIFMVESIHQKLQAIKFEAFTNNNNNANDVQEDNMKDNKATEVTVETVETSLRMRVHDAVDYSFDKAEEVGATLSNAKDNAHEALVKRKERIAANWMEMKASLQDKIDAFAAWKQARADAKADAEKEAEQERIHQVRLECGFYEQQDARIEDRKEIVALKEEVVALKEEVVLLKEVVELINKPEGVPHHHAINAREAEEAEAEKEELRAVVVALIEEAEELYRNDNTTGLASLREIASKYQVPVKLTNFKTTKKKIVAHLRLVS